MDLDSIEQPLEQLQRNEEEERLALSHETAKSKYSICLTCEQFYPRLKLCKNCFCFMPAKVRVIGTHCPEGKW